MSLWPASWRTSVPPPLVTLAAAAGMAWTSNEVPGWSSAWAFHQVIGLAIGLTATWWMLLALWTMLSHRTTFNPLSPAQAQHLVTEGVFARSRNPIYLADMLLLLGWWWWLGEWTAGWGLLVFWGWMSALQIPAEEAALRVRFGQDFVTYCQQVRRWV